MPLNPLDALLPEEDRARTEFRWGTVTALDPLQVQLDRDTEPQTYPSTVRGPHTVGERVFLVIFEKRATVLGVSGRVDPGTGQITTTTSTTAAPVTTTTTTQGWVSYSPMLTAATSNPSGRAHEGRYLVQGPICHVEVYVTLTGGGSSGEGVYYIALPLPAIGYSSSFPGEMFGTTQFGTYDGPMRATIVETSATKTWRLQYLAGGTDWTSITGALIPTGSESTFSMFGSYRIA